MGTVGDAGNYGDVAISPDGRRIAVHFHEEPQGGNIWLWDMQSRELLAVHLRPVAQHGADLVSRRSLDSVCLQSGRRSFSTCIARSPLVRRLRSSFSNRRSTKSPRRGQRITAGSCCLRMGGPRSDWTVWRLPLSGDQMANQLKPSNASEFLSEFSPDGRWIAYTGTETGHHRFSGVRAVVPGAEWTVAYVDERRTPPAVVGRRTTSCSISTPKGWRSWPWGSRPTAPLLSASTPRAVIKTRVTGRSRSRRHAV